MIPGQVFKSVFTVSDGGGSLVNADTAPSAVVFMDGVLRVITPSIESLAAAGKYSYSFTVPEAWVHGQVVVVQISCTIDSVPMTSSISRMIDVAPASSLTTEDIAGAVWSYDFDTLVDTTKTLAGNVLKKALRILKFLQVK